jgi:hypothetical protein
MRTIEELRGLNPTKLKTASLPELDSLWADLTASPDFYTEMRGRDQVASDKHLLEIWQTVNSRRVELQVSQRVAEAKAKPRVYSVQQSRDAAYQIRQLMGDPKFQADRTGESGEMARRAAQENWEMLHTVAYSDFPKDVTWNPATDEVRDAVTGKPVEKV